MHSVFQLRCRGGAGVSLLLATISVAQAQTDSTRVFQMGDVVVTGHRPVGLDRTTANPERSADPVRDAGHAIARLPGVELENVGARSETQVLVRGFDSRQVALYIDGVPVYVPYDGNVDLARFSNEELSLVQVEKGASSLAYGPNAMGGAINLVTRVPTAPLEASAHAGMHTLQGQEGGLRIGTRQNSWYLIGTASGRNLEGWELPEDWTAKPAENGGRRDNSWSHDRTLHAKGGWIGDSGAQAALSITDQHGAKGTPPYAGRNPSPSVLRYWKWPYWDKQSVHQTNVVPILPWLQLGSSLYWDAFQNSLFAYDDATYTTQKKKSSFRSNYDDHTYGGSVYARAAWKQDTLKIFAHLKNDLHHEGNTTNDTAKSTTNSVFIAKPDLEFEDRTVSSGIEGVAALPFDLTFSPGFGWSRRQALRADNLLETKAYQYSIQSFALSDADAWDGQGVLRWNPSGTQQFKIALSSRTRFPTIKDRYSYRLGTAIPNPDLGPERSLQVELGYAGMPCQGLSVQVGLWEAWLDDALQTVTRVGSAGESQMRNTGAARFEGPRWLGDDAPTWTRLAPEIAVSYELPWRTTALRRLSISGSYAFLRRRNIDHPQILYIDEPVHSAKGWLLWSPIVPLDLVWNTRASSSRTSSSDGIWHAKAFAVHDILARLRYRNASLAAGLKNAFDEDYALSEGYPEEGRSGTIDLSINL